MQMCSLSPVIDGTLTLVPNSLLPQFTSCFRMIAQSFARVYAHLSPVLGCNVFFIRQIVHEASGATIEQNGRTGEYCTRAHRWI
jgi:hypothetical protein